MNPARLFLSLLIAATFALSARAELPPPAPPEALWAVQVFVSRANEAGDSPNAVSAQVEELGFGPYWEHEVDEGEEGIRRYGLVGKLDSMTDAIILRNQLREAGVAEATERSFPSLMADDFRAEIRSPVLPIFSPQRHAYESRATPMTSEKVDAFADFGSLDDSQLEALAKVFTTLDLPMKEKKRLACLLAREMTRRLSKTYYLAPEASASEAHDIIRERIFPFLLPAASDEVLDEWTLEARWIAATLWHEYIEDRLSAYRAIRQIVEEHAESNEAVRARGTILWAALVRELSHEQRGDIGESRRISAMAYEVIPPEYESARATAELIYWQSYFSDENHELIVRGLTGLADRYPSAVRERAGALFAVARAQVALGNHEEAVEALKELLALRMAPSDMFHWAGRRNNVQLAALPILRDSASRIGMDVEKEVEEFLDSIHVRPPADESFDPAFALEILGRTAKQATEGRRPLSDAVPVVPMDETERWLRIDAEGRGLDYEVHVRQLREQLEQSGLSEEGYAAFVKRHLTLSPEELMRESYKDSNARSAQYDPGMPPELGFAVLEQPGAHVYSVTGYSAYGNYSVYLTYREVWLGRPEGGFTSLIEQEPSQQFQEAIVGQFGPHTVAIIRDRQVVFDLILGEDVQAEMSMLLDEIENPSTPPEKLIILDVENEIRRSLHIDSPGTWVAGMWIQSRTGDLLLARGLRSGEIVIERMALSPDPFDESARFTRVATFTGPLTAIDYDEITDTFTGSRFTDDGRSVITQWSVDNPSTPLAKRFVDGACMSHKAFDGRVVALTGHWNHETQRQSMRLVSIDQNSDAPPEVIKDFEPFNWGPHEIVALDEDEVILLGQLRPRLVGPAALEQSDIPEIGLISAPLP